MVKTILTALTLSATLLGAAAHVYADETLGEKAEATSNDAARAAKKGVNRAKEAVCMESDTKCLAEKAKHRAEEAKDYTKDKASEIKNDIDSK